MEKLKKQKKQLTVRQKINRRTFLSFTTFLAAGGISFGGWKWLFNSSEEPSGITGGARLPLRKALNKTELFFRNFYSNNHLVKTYPKSLAASKVRVNSNIGIDDRAFDPLNWKLKVVSHKTKSFDVTIDQIKALPKTEIVFDFKCVEGWDQIQYWGGVKFSDFIAHFELSEESKLPYVGMETPNGEYYVGLETESAIHPQTLLAYEMNGEAILPEHGAPLRLIIPVKYGIKNLKRIGKISFTENRPKDYWAEQGYDYNSGL
jgi:DMSO/TMAO reductase YedYZ molybdopterin-dependent catalytic subunit